MNGIKTIWKKNLVELTIGLVLTLVYPMAIHAASIRAGVSKINITKDNPASLVNDPLYARILVLDDGKNKVVIISMDIININLSDLSVIRKRIQSDLKIDGNNVLVNASHNHWVNDQLAEDYIERTLKGVKEASLKMVPVKVGAGSGVEKRITMNRRLILTNGKEWTIRRATPDPQDQNVKGIAKPFDPEIGILRIDRLDNKPLAALFTFAGHNYTGVPNRGASAGFPGFASKLIENNLGNDAVAIYFQGAAGDITPILYKDTNTPKQEETFGMMLGLSTLEGLRNITVKKEAKISLAREELILPARTDIQQHIDSLEAKKAIILDYFKGQGCGAHGAGTKLNFKAFLPLYIMYMMSPGYPSDNSYRYLQEEKIGVNNLKMMDEDNERDMLKYLNCIYKMEELLAIEANLGYLKTNKPKDPIKTEIIGFKIGDFVLIAFTGEVFCQVGLNIKNLSPYEHTFVSGYTNGSVGYLPTADAYNGDAYEVSLSIVAPEWQKKFEEKAMEIIKKL